MPRSIGIPTSKIARAIHTTLKNERFTLSGVFCFIFAHNQFLKNLNAQFRHVRRETDVISFSYISDEKPFIPLPHKGEDSGEGSTSFSPHPDLLPHREKGSPDAPLADIYISEEKAAENARRFKESMERELLRLIIHGILHALGYTDYEPKAKKKMWAHQERALSQI